MSSLQRAFNTLTHMETDTKKALLIINPHSGTRSKRGVADYVGQRLSDNGFMPEVKLTGGPGDATRLAREAAEEGCHMVIAIGGDGTMNETASGLCDTHTALGIIPLGSGNGLARSLNIPTDTAFATDVILQQNVLVCDRGMVNSRNFYCTFGVGFDAAVSQKFATEKRRGKTTYMKNVIKEFLKYSPQAYAISIGGNVITEKAFLIAVCNAQQYGNNAYIAPHARVDDGLLDMIVVHSGNIIENAMVGVDMLTGYIDRNTLIESFRISAATITRLDEGPAHVDGEPVNLGRVLEIECKPASLRIIAPAQDRTFKPIISPMKSLIDDIRYDIRAAINKK